MKLQFTIENITESNGGKTLVLKLTQKIAMFGIADAKKQTFYLGGVNIAAKDKIAVGQVVEEDLTRFWIVERETMLIEENGKGTFMTLEEAEKSGKKGIVMKMKWLHDKMMYPEKPAA